MQELRLAPAALVMWGATICCLLIGLLPAGFFVVATALVFFCAREKGQAILVAGLGAASLICTSLRIRIATSFALSHEVGRSAEFPATVLGQPKPLSSGGFLTNVSLDGYPAKIPVFAPELDDSVVSGASVAVSGQVRESTFPGIGTVTVNGEVDTVAAPRGFAAFAHHVRATFGQSVQANVGDAAGGLIPGMVLGDTQYQTEAEQQAYIDTGLSHLSAVSGANVAIVTTFAIVVASLVGLGLRGRLIAAAIALSLFAALIGPDPSVLRASVTGLVGVVAVVASARVEPIHALCLSVIVLIFIDPDLAVHFGFALSVAATAGIVALNPLLYRALAVTGWPDIVVRALAVAIAADLATIPIIALMTGQVSLVSVAANVLVAPVVPLITVLGLIAVVLALLPGGLEVVLLRAMEPFAWWVHKVATWGSEMPFALIDATPAAALVAYGWIVAGLVAGRPRLTFATIVSLILVLQAPFAGHGRTLDPGQLTAHVVESKEDVEPIPAGTQVVVVLESGRPHSRPVQTASGIPVLFPNRDGPVRLYADGTQELRGSGP